MQSLKKSTFFAIKSENQRFNVSVVLQDSLSGESSSLKLLL